MNNMFALGILVVGAFLIQSALGFFQIRHFGTEYNELKADGRVAIGKRAGKLTSGTIIMFQLDAEGVIVRGKKLQGTTILARFKPYNNFNGRSIEAIKEDDPDVLAEIKITRKTIMNAVTNYRMFMNGEIIPEKESPFKELTKKITHIKFG
ncbi:MAG: glucitol operon activator protein [Trichococcus sp.]|jgi:DNA-binding transcriptional regulator of glucitol operon|nr:glucitol operon activator protein [Trichococcus sp.]